MVPRYTTPTFVLVLPAEVDGEPLDLTAANNVYVTFTSGSYVLTKIGDALTLTANTISVYLTQKETARFQIGDVEVQANWTDSAGHRAASDVMTFEVTKQLLMAVVE